MTWPCVTLEPSSTITFESRPGYLEATDTPWAPWRVVQSDDKKRARLNVITHLLSQVPYEELPREKPALPKRQKPHGYREPDYPYKLVPELGWGDDGG